jgi:hypothetical protein
VKRHFFERAMKQQQSLDLLGNVGALGLEAIDLAGHVFRGHGLVRDRPAEDADASRSVPEFHGGKR